MTNSLTYTQFYNYDFSIKNNLCIFLFDEIKKASYLLPKITNAWPAFSLQQ